MITAIGFSGGFLPGQLAIQAATFDLSAHCFAIIGDRVIDATYQHGVKERRLAEINCHWMDFCPVDYLTVTQNLCLEYWLRCQIGKKYDTGFIFGWQCKIVNKTATTKTYSGTVVAAGTKQPAYSSRVIEIIDGGWFIGGLTS